MSVASFFCYGDGMSDPNPKQNMSDGQVAAFPLAEGLGRQLPQNLEAEQELLGALLLDNSILENIDDGLREDHFFDPAHGRIFAAISNLTGRGNLANPITLKSYFANDDSFGGLNIETYLNELAESVLSLSEASEYARDVRECYLRRELIRSSDELISKARSADLNSPASTMIEEAEQRLFNLAENDQGQSGLNPFSMALDTALKMADEASVVFAD